MSRYHIDTFLPISMLSVMGTVHKYLASSAQFQTVFVKANFLKVSDINTIKEEFVAEVVVAVRWREPALDNTKVRFVI